MRTISTNTVVVDDGIVLTVHVFFLIMLLHITIVAFLSPVSLQVISCCELRVWADISFYLISLEGHGNLVSGFVMGIIGGIIWLIGVVGDLLSPQGPPSISLKELFPAVVVATVSLLSSI